MSSTKVWYRPERKPSIEEGTSSANCWMMTLLSNSARTMGHRSVLQKYVPVIKSILFGNLDSSSAKLWITDFQDLKQKVLG